MNFDAEREYNNLLNKGITYENIAEELKYRKKYIEFDKEELEEYNDTDLENLLDMY